RASNDGVDGKIAAAYVKNTLNLSNVAIIRDSNSTFSVGAANDFKNAFLAFGGTTITNDEDAPCPSGGDFVAADYTATLMQINDGSHPQLIYIAPQTATSAGNFIIEIKTNPSFSAIKNLPLWGANAANSQTTIDTADAGNASAEGFYTTGPFPNPTGFVNQYV